MNEGPRRRVVRWTTGAMLTMAAACGPSESETIPTDEIAPELRAIEYSSGTEVWAQLADASEAGLPFSRLVGGDALQATLGDEKKRLEYYWDESRVQYMTVFSRWPPPPNTRVQVDFTRTEWSSAIGSYVDMPPPFRILEDELPNIARSEPLVISWEPVVPGSTMRVRFVGSCAWTDTKDVVDEGRVEIAPADWEATQQGTECCQTHLLVDRVVDGVVAPEFGAGGSFEGIQRRYLDRFTFPSPGGSVDGC